MFTVGCIWEYCSQNNPCKQHTKSIPKCPYYYILFPNVNSQTVADNINIVSNKLKKTGCAENSLKLLVGLHQSLKTINNSNSSAIINNNIKGRNYNVIMENSGH